MAHKSADHKHKGRIALVGFMGSGKTSIARCLRSLGVSNVLEMDDELERRAGSSINEIFRNRGEPVFRDMEAALLLEAREMEPCILSCGGGVVVRADNRRILKEAFFTIWLKASAEVLEARLAGKTDRPLLGPAQPALSSAVLSLMAQREPLYAEVSRLTIDTDHQKPEQIARTLIDEVGIPIGS